MVCGKKITIWV